MLSQPCNPAVLRALSLSLSLSLSSSSAGVRSPPTDAPMLSPGLRDLLVKLVAHHGDDEVISKFEATTVKKDKFIELYKTLPGEHDMVDG